MRFWIISALLCSTLLMVAPVQAQDEPSGVSNAAVVKAQTRYSQSFEFRSAINGSRYRVDVFVPRSPAPARGYPSIFLLDGDALFGTFAEAVRTRGQAREIEAAVVVGISGGDRTLDFSPTALSPRECVIVKDLGQDAKFGGAELFYRVVTEEIRPKVATMVATDSARATLFGWSLAGQFVTRTLFKHPGSRLGPRLGGAHPPAGGVHGISGMFRDCAGKAAASGSLGGKMAKKAKLHLDDIEIVATLVARTLRDRGETNGPEVADYFLMSQLPNGSTGLEVRLKLTKALTVDLVGDWWPDQKLSALVELAEEIADAVTEARSDIPGVENLVAEVTREARRQVANARRRGLRYRLQSVTPTEIEIGTSFQPSATMRVAMLNRALAPEAAVFNIEDIEEVDSMFRSCEVEQRARAQAKWVLESENATGAIDAVLLRALEQRGVDVAEILVRMHIDLPGQDRKTRLYWDNGVIRSSIVLAEGTTWQEGLLTFNSAPHGLDGKLTGKPVKTIFDHPYLGVDTLVLRSKPATPGGVAMVNCTDKLMRFDARSGRVWETRTA